MSSRTATRPRRRNRPRKAGADYMRLVRAFPLCPLQSHAEYESAAAILDRLAVQSEGLLSPGEQAYLETLTLLMQSYDDEHFKIVTKRMPPLEVLKYLMDESGMISADLGKLLKNKALASLILNGHRELSKAHIQLLSEYFKVEPGLFLETR